MLADRPRGEGMVVSCYADTSVSSGVRPLWHEHLKNEVKAIVETLTGDPAQRAAFERNVAAIEAVLSSRRTVAARGMAVFAAVQRDLVNGYMLTVPVPHRLVVDEEPYLVPLLELLNRQRRYLVVHTDTHRGRLYTAVPGAVRLIEEISEDVPKRHRAGGELWGKQQATIDRRREDHVLHYFKELVREIERAWPEEQYDGVVLLGEHDILENARLMRCLPQSRPAPAAGTAVSTARSISFTHRVIDRNQAIVAPCRTVRLRNIRPSDAQPRNICARRGKIQIRIHWRPSRWRDCQRPTHADRLAAAACERAIGANARGLGSANLEPVWTRRTRYVSCSTPSRLVDY